MRPSTYTCEPLRRYSPAISASFPKNFTRCHSVFSWLVPSRSLRTVVVARRTEVTAIPPWVYLVSGSSPRLPTRITLLMPRAMECESSNAGGTTAGPADRRASRHMVPAGRGCACRPGCPNWNLAGTPASRIHCRPAAVGALRPSAAGRRASGHLGLAGQLDEVADVACAELAHDLHLVGADGLVAQAHVVADVAVGLARDQAAEHFELALGQPRDRPAVGLPFPRQRQQFLVEVGLAAGDDQRGHRNLRHRVGLVDEPVGPGPQRAQAALVRFAARHDQDAELRAAR